MSEHIVTESELVLPALWLMALRNHSGQELLSTLKRSIVIPKTRGQEL